MNTAAELVREVYRAGGSFRVVGDAVKVRRAPPELLDALKARRDEIKRLILTNATTPANDPTASTQHRVVIRYWLADGRGGTVLAAPGDTEADILADLIDRYGSRLVTAMHHDRVVWPTDSGVR